MSFFKAYKGWRWFDQTVLFISGSSILPPHLDFFNYSREEMAASESGSKAASSVGKSKSQRESTPDSTSTSSGANEEVAEAASMATPSPVSNQHLKNFFLM